MAGGESGAISLSLIRLPAQLLFFLLVASTNLVGLEGVALGTRARTKRSSLSHVLFDVASLASDLQSAAAENATTSNASASGASAVNVSFLGVDGISGPHADVFADGPHASSMAVMLGFVAAGLLALHGFIVKGSDDDDPWKTSATRKRTVYRKALAANSSMASNESRQGDDKPELVRDEDEKENTKGFEYESSST